MIDSVHPREATLHSDCQPPRFPTRVVGLAVAVALALSVACGFPFASATQGSPSWAQGNVWTFNGTYGIRSVTERWTLIERTTLLLANRTHDVWHFNATTTSSGGGSVETEWRNLWVEQADFGIIKEVVVAYSSVYVYTYEPAWTQAMFPLNQNDSWSKVTRVTGSFALGNATFMMNYSARVVGERNVVVPAGTFASAAIRHSATSSGFIVDYYAEGVGYYVRIEYYDRSGVLAGSLNLVSFHRQDAYLTLVLGIALGIAGSAAVLIIVFVRRRRGPRSRLPTEPPWTNR